MQGKPINVARASASQIQKNERAEALYRRITRNKSDAFDPSYVPFERVILLTDGDPDGVHAKALLLLLIHREVPDLIEQEQLLTVRAPQYGITCDQRTHPVFAYSIEGRDSVIRQLDQRGATSIHTHHYKGLAGMDRDDLWRHCVSVEDRELSLLTLDHVRAAQRALS